MQQFVHSVITLNRLLTSKSEPFTADNYVAQTRPWLVSREKKCNSHLRIDYFSSQKIRTLQSAMLLLYRPGTWQQPPRVPL